MRLMSLLATVALLQAGQVTTQTSRKPGPNVWIYNAVQSGPEVKLDLLLDGASVASAVSNDSLSGPFSPKDPKAAVVAVRKAEGTASLLEVPLNTTETDHVLALVGDPDKKVDFVDLGIKITPETNGQPRISVLSAIPKDDAGDDIDIYVLGANDKVESVQPAAKAIAYKAAAAIPVAPGTYTIVVTKTGAKDILAQSDAVEFKAKDRKAVIALPKTPDRADKLAVVSL